MGNGQDFDMDVYLDATKFGAALEVLDMMLQEGFDEAEATQLIQGELTRNPDNYNSPEDINVANHKEYGYSGRLNAAINSIREMIQQDVIKILESGHKPQILALMEDFEGYIAIIRSFEEEQEEQEQQGQQEPEEGSPQGNQE